MKILILLCFMTLCLSQMPIPNGKEGVNFGGKKSKHVLNVFYDLLCSGSALFHQEFKSFLNQTYQGQTWFDLFDINFHFFPLPYHRNSFLVTLISPYIKENLGAAGTWQLMDWAFAKQNDFLQGAKNLNEYEVIEKICTQASQSISNFTYNSCNDVFYNDVDYKWQMASRISWKYACYNGIMGTPIVHLNGVIIADIPFDAQGMNTYFTDFFNNKGKNFLLKESL